MRLAEKVGGVLCLLMQFYYCARQAAGLRKIRHSLANYYVLAEPLAASARPEVQRMDGEPAR